MTTLTELKTKADHLGLAPEMVRLYGDLRAKATWEKAITANKTITVDAVEVDAVEVEETIPFTHDDNLHLPPNRREMALEELARQREIFEHHNAHNAVDLPTPPPIVINVPAERRDIPPALPPSIPPDRTEIAEKPNTSPRPGEGRGDERFIDPDICSIAEKATAMRALLKSKTKFPRQNEKGFDDLLLDRIKSDILRYFQEIAKELQYCLEKNYLDQKLHKELKTLVQDMEWNINNKYSIYSIWATVPYFQKVGFNRLIPFAIQDFFKDARSLVDCWSSTRKTYWLVVERPTPIPTFFDKFAGVLIPNRIHQLGLNIFVWKFPGCIEAENFFNYITNARKYCMIPANSDLKIDLNKPLLLGV